MKKTFIATAIFGTFSTLTHAASNFEVYGLVDDGIASITHSLPTSSTFAFSLNPYNIAGSGQNRYTGPVSGGASMSRVGVKGEGDLGGGISAFFNLESAINSVSGQIANHGQSILNNAHTLSTISGASSIDGQLFSRAAYAGLKDASLGSLEIGRTTAFALEQTAAFDPLHASGLYSPIGFSGAIGGGLGITENARLDNSIKYENTIGKTRFGAQYKVGQPNSSEAADLGTVFQGMVGYKDGPLDLQLSAGRSINSADMLFTLYSSAVNLKIQNTAGYMATGKYDFSSKTTLEFGFERMVQSQPSSANAWGTQVTSYYGMNISNGALSGTNTPSSFNGSATTTTIWLGGNYKVSDRFSLDGAYYNINNGFNSALNAQQYTIQAFSLMGVYKFDKSINFGGVPLDSDVYAGVMTSGYSGPFIAQKETALNLGLATRNTIIGTGVRVRF